MNLWVPATVTAEALSVGCPDILTANVPSPNEISVRSENHKIDEQATRLQ